MKIFRKFTFEEDDEISKNVTVFISHFENTRMEWKDSDGFYGKKGFLSFGWKFKLKNGKEGRFLALKDNGNGTFCTKPTRFTINTYAWQDLEMFI